MEFNSHAAESAVIYLAGCPGTVDMLTLAIEQNQKRSAESAAKHIEQQAAYENYRAAVQASAQYDDNLENHTTGEHKTAEAIAYGEQLRKKAERAKAVWQKTKETPVPPGGHVPTLPSDAIIAAAAKVKVPQRPVTVDVPKPFAKYAESSDPAVVAAGVELARDRLDEIDSAIDAVFDAVLPQKEAVSNFMSAFRRRSESTAYPWGSLTRVREGVDGRVAVGDVPPIPAGIMAEALHNYVAIFVEDQVKEAIARQKEKGLPTLSIAERGKRLRARRAEYDAVEAVECFLVRRLAALTGEIPWLRPDTNVKTLMGIETDPEHVFERGPSFVEAPKGTHPDALAKMLGQNGL
jgi:HPt (histidine-containing phosphotransfer) domain-containing protein